MVEELERRYCLGTGFDIALHQLPHQVRLIQQARFVAGQDGQVRLCRDEKGAYAIELHPHRGGALQKIPLTLTEARAVLAELETTYGQDTSGFSPPFNLYDPQAMINRTVSLTAAFLHLQQGVMGAFMAGNFAGAARLACEQGYTMLSDPPHTPLQIVLPEKFFLRVRQEKKRGFKRTQVTLKGPNKKAGSFVNHRFELNLSANELDGLYQHMPASSRISKTRYSLGPLSIGTNVDVDFYQRGSPQHPCVVEIEFPSIRAASDFVPDRQRFPWIGEEITAQKMFSPSAQKMVGSGGLSSGSGSPQTPKGKRHRHLRLV